MNCLNLDWENIDRFGVCMNRSFFSPFYTQIHQLSIGHKGVMSAAALCIGLIDGVAQSILAVGVIGETTVKGLRNVVVGGGQDRLRGKYQLLSLPLNFIIYTVTPFARSIKITYQMAVDPVETSRVESFKAQSQIPVRHT